MRPEDHGVTGGAAIDANVARWIIELTPDGAFGIVSHPTDPFVAFGMLEMAKQILTRKIMAEQKQKPQRVQTFPPGAVPNIRGA